MANGLEIQVTYQDRDPAELARVAKVREGVKLIAAGLDLGDVVERTHTYPNGQALKTFTAG